MQEDTRGFCVLTPKELASRIGVQERTAYAHIKRGGWERQKQGREPVKFAVPWDFLELYRASAEPMQEDSGAEPEPSGYSSGFPPDEILSHIKQAHEAVVQSKDDLIAELRSQIERLVVDKSVMRNEQEALHHALKRRPRWWRFWER